MSDLGNFQPEPESYRILHAKTEIFPGRGGSPETSVRKDILVNCRGYRANEASLPSDDLQATNSAGSAAGSENLMMEPEDFAGLSREEQLKVLEGKSWVKNIDFNQSFAELHSLTGGKKAKWKFQDSFYGNFNVGRRPSQDTAWGRR